MIELIVAFDRKYNIGNNGVLPWNFMKDLEHFKNITVEINNFNNKNVVIMGRKTWKSIPDRYRSLKNRINIVVSKSMSQQELDDDNKTFELTYLVETLDDAIKLCNNIDTIEKIFIIGGGSLYKEAIEKQLIDHINITFIDSDFDGDVKFPIDEFRINYPSAYENLQKLINQSDKIYNSTYKKVQDINSLNNMVYTLHFIRMLVVNPLKLINNLNSVKINHEEKAYINLLNKILTSDTIGRETRNGRTYSIFGETLQFDLNAGFPLLTTKKMFWRGIVEELLFFIKGDTNTNLLSEKNIRIWEPNTTREFLDNLNLKYDVGDMGPMYGFNWRHFGAEYKDMNSTYDGIDQLSYVINLLKNDPFNRRIVMTTFDPKSVDKCVLYPCHGLITQFYVRSDGSLDCSTYQRSADAFLGLPFNISSYSLLVYLLCDFINRDPSKKIKLKPGRLLINLGDIHLYEEHIAETKEIIKREPYMFPLLRIYTDEIKNITDYKIENLELINYKFYPPIRVGMKA